MYKACFPNPGVFAMDLILRWLFVTHHVGGVGDRPELGRPRRMSKRLLFFLLVAQRRLQDRAMDKAKTFVSLPDMHEAMLGTRELAVKFDVDPHSAFWRKRDHSSGVRSAPPCAFVLGWYDIFLQDQLKDYESRHPPIGHKRDIEASSTSPSGPSGPSGPANPESTMIIGPWFHYEALHLPHFLTILRDTLPWLHSKLKPNEPARPNSVRRRRPVRLYVMGSAQGATIRGEWREFDQWPPRSDRTNFYLHSGGGDDGGNDGSSDGDGDGGGLLRMLPPTNPHLNPSQSEPENHLSVAASEGWSRYTYDPHNPTPSKGGAKFHVVSAGVADQWEIEQRADVLCFTSPPLASAVEIIGYVELLLYVSVLNQDHINSVDFVGRLCDVCPDGRSYNVTDGMVREIMERKEGKEEGTLTCAPGDRDSASASVVAAGECDDDIPVTHEPRQVNVSLGATAKLFPAGHRIRLQVCSGDHPRWMRNSGQGGFDSLKDSSVLLTEAHPVIHHSADFPSTLILPVVSGGHGDIGLTPMPKAGTGQSMLRKVVSKGLLSVEETLLKVSSHHNLEAMS